MQHVKNKPAHKPNLLSIDDAGWADWSESERDGMTEEFTLENRH